MQSCNDTYWKYKLSCVQIYIKTFSYTTAIFMLSDVYRLLSGRASCLLDDGFIFTQTTWDVGSCSLFLMSVIFTWESMGTNKKDTLEYWSVLTVWRRCVNAANLSELTLNCIMSVYLWKSVCNIMHVCMQYSLYSDISLFAYAQWQYMICIVSVLMLVLNVTCVRLEVFAAVMLKVQVWHDIVSLHD